MINILLVDNHDLVRNGIRSLLNDVRGIQVIGEAKSGEEAVMVVRDLKPHIILMDVKMPGIGGLEATRKLLRVYPEAKIIALTIYGEEPFPSRLLQAGASGYITKGSSVDEMVLAIKI